MARIAMRHAAAAAMIAVALSGCCGMDSQCAAPPGYPAAPGYPTAQSVPAAPVQPVVSHPNPVFIPIADPQCAWEKVVDVVDDYFRIESEQPARIVGNVSSPGTLTTVAEVSPTIFEPWRHDTVDPEQWLENSLQTMHRQAVVHVTPVQGGQWIDVAVYKRLENLKRPEQSTAGVATFRYDSTLTRVVNPVTGEQPTLGWIAQGRDTSLEQQIIGDLLCRCGQAGSPVIAAGPAGGPVAAAGPVGSPAVMPGPAAQMAPGTVGSPMMAPGPAGQLAPGPVPGR